MQRELEKSSASSSSSSSSSSQATNATRGNSCGNVAFPLSSDLRATPSISDGSVSYMYVHVHVPRYVRPSTCTSADAIYPLRTALHALPPPRRKQIFDLIDAAFSMPLMAWTEIKRSSK